MGVIDATVTDLNVFLVMLMLGSSTFCQACNDQTFGSNCTNLCHCPPNDSCSAINGYCSSGGCDPDWGGTACQIRLPKLNSPPQVQNGTCTLLYVTWRPWKKDTDIGDPEEIDSYTVEQRVNYTMTNFTAQWTFIGKVQSANDSRQYTIQAFFNDSYNFLEFRVITNWLDLGKPFPGRPSDPSPVVRPITFCVDPPGPVTSLKVEVLSSNIRLNWTAPVSNSSTGLSGYNISYGVIGIGDCNATYREPMTFILLSDASTTSYTIQNTVPWRKYLITISAINFAGHGSETNTIVISQETAPSGVARNLTTQSVTSRQVSLVWEDVACEDRGGILVAYEVMFKDPSGVTGQRNTTQRSLIVTDLIPFTRYGFTVRYVNRIGSGPSSTEYFITTMEDDDTEINISLTVRPVTSPSPSSGAVLAVGGLTAGEKAAIGILVPLAILLIILGLLLFYFCWWRKRKEEKERDANNRTWLQFYKSNFSDMPKKKWNDIYSLEDPRYILTNDDVGGPDDIYVDDLPHRRKTISFEDEYRQLPEGLVFLCTEAQKEENADKNRFDHLLAYDHTRVHLENSNDGSDYYNANYIPGYDRRRKAYIAAQSPFNERSISDFWLMVYEQKILKIVFLAQLLEESIVKSEKYWSDDHLTHHYGSIAVTLIRTHSYANFVIRTFSINKTGQYGVRTVTQYQFTAWPEHGVPEDPFAILEFRRKVGLSAEAPLMVHCGTGVSRSAVYIAIDFCLAKAEAENIVNVYRCCSTMRQCRTMMVRTLKQYIFIYEALFEALIASHLIVRQDVKSVYDFLKKTNPKTNTTFFKEQLHILEKYLEDPTDNQCKTALSPENRAKNRFSTLRLIVRDRDLIPMRSPDRPNRLAYINALTLNSYTRRNGFIVTQSPLATTVADFWNLIYDQKVCCIVALNGQSFRDDTCVQYWPSVQKVVQKVDGGFRLTLLAEEHKEHVIVRTLQLTRDDISTAEDSEPRDGRGIGRGKGKARSITQYQFQSWNMYDQIPWSNGGFLELIDSISRERRAELYDVPSDAAADGYASTGAGFGRLPPVVVHCIDGASQSGLFCACYVICQKMNLDKEVDVFHSIKEMKRKRFHFVNSLDQYKFCFKLLWDFVNFRMTPSTA